MFTIVKKLARISHTGSDVYADDWRPPGIWWRWRAVRSILCAMVRESLVPPLLLSVTLAVAGCASTVQARPEAFPRSGISTPEAGRPAPARASGTTLAAPSPDTGVLQTALGQRGVRYHLGGNTPADGFDCSGLVQYVFNQHGIRLPRTTAEQFQTGVEVRPGDVTTGDLVFFSTNGPGPTHVGIVLEPGVFIHAPDSGSVVRVERFDTPYWSPRLLGVRRISG